MKKMMMALAALCVAGAASAVTVKWNDATGGDLCNPDNDETLKDAYSVAAVVTITSIPSDVNNNPIITFGQWNGGFSYIYLYGGTSGDRGSLGAQINTSWGGVTPLGELGAGIKVSLVAVYTGLSGTKQLTIYVNGKEVMTAAPGVNINGLSVTGKTNDAWTIDGMVGYEGALSEEQIKYLSANQLALLPEPTALALLALGVAGLALRRKAA